MERSGTLRWRDLANPSGALTLARLPLGAAFPFVVETPAAALALYLAGVGTDVLDGLVARARGEVSQAGAIADGVADKAFHAIVAGTLAWTGAIPPAWLALWFSREIGQALLVPWFALHWRRAPERGRHANRLGKLTTLFLGAAVIAALLGWRPGALGLSIVTGALGLGSAFVYAWRETRDPADYEADRTSREPRDRT